MLPEPIAIMKIAANKDREQIGMDSFLTARAPRQESSALDALLRVLGLQKQPT
jgi:hypothetical protein